MSSETPRWLRRCVHRVGTWIEERGVDTDLLGGPVPERLGAVVLAVLAGSLTFLIATTVFPQHSANHDEGVYLLQASMLLEGHLEIRAGPLAEAVRPWFFVEDAGRLYPKYSPVPAAMYAVSMALFGEPRVTLAVVAAGNTALVYWLGALAFDRRVGLVAGCLFVLSPMTLITSAVFLPYAPTTLLNLLFAVAYLRGMRSRSLVTGAGAGLAIGLSFFSRPLTAVLFATPFIAHAGWMVWRSAHSSGFWPPAEPIRRNAVTAVLGLAFVGLTLAYNARVTGSVLTFPYEAFAPLDGPGFGYRQILGHSMVYTPELAAEANGYVLWSLGSRWFVGGVIGTLCAIAGLATASRHWRAHSVPGPQRTAGLCLSVLFVTVPAGNVFFWGNRNILATMADPTDGLIALFGPFYHFDLLAPLSIFAAFALVSVWRARDTIGHSNWGRAVRVLSVVCLAVLLISGGAVNATVLSGAIERNQAYTERYESAYEPIEAAEFENALVFLPTPYGDWLGHPFQSLRNEPGLDGPVVYALDRGPAEDFAVVDAFPNRTYYRYAYQGEWTAAASDTVDPKLERLRVHRGRALDAETTVGVPDPVTRAIVEIESDRGEAAYDVADLDDQLSVPWRLTPETATLTESPHNESDAAVAIGDADELIVTVTMVTRRGETLTYRQAVTTRTTDTRVEVLWPPERTVCPVVANCGTEGTYLPNTPDAHLDGVTFDTEVEGDAQNRSRESSRSTSQY